MKNLVLNNGASFAFTDSSTINNLKTVVSDYEEIAPYKAAFTVDNFKKCTFDGVEYIDVIPISIDTDNSAGGKNIAVTLTTRNKTAIEYLQEQGQQITELQEALADIIG